MTRRKSSAEPRAIVSASEHRRAIAKHIESLAYAHSKWNVFSDFVETAALSISNAVDLAQSDVREARYAEIATRYSVEEMAAFPEMFAELVLALEGGFDDVLGRLFHDFELHNHYTGQFFTPYDLCGAMAKITLSRDGIDRAIAERGFITVLEPACGGGAMLVAAAEALKDEGINYQQQLHCTAIDVDLKCVHMAYVQLALLGLPAVVIHGNSLSMEEYSRWYTPAHILGGWSLRLAPSEAEPSKETESSTPPDESIDANVEVPDLDGQLVLL